MKNFKNYNLFNILIFNIFFCFYAFSQDINSPDQYAKDVNERIEKSSKKELRFLSKNLLEKYLKENEDLNLEIDINAKLNNKINNQQSLIGNFENKVEQLNNKISNQQSIINGLESEETILKKSNQNLKNYIKDRDSLYNELIVERDSLIQDAILNMDSEINKNEDDFLNKMLLKKVKIDNQSFKLVPHGIITKSIIGDPSDYDDLYIDQFIPLSNLLIGIISQPIKFELSRSFANSYEFLKTAFWNPIRKMTYTNFISTYDKYFTTFNFTQGRLLNIKTIVGESDYLSVISDYPEQKNYNDKGFFFELVDDNQEKLIIPTIVIGNELYIYLDTEDFEKLNYTFQSSVLEASVNSSTNYKRANYEYDNADELLNAHRQLNNISIISISKYKKDYYEEENNKDKLGLYFFTKNNSLYRKSRNVIPSGFLFKLEEIN